MPGSGAMDSDLRNTCAHLIDYASRKQRHVTRSTFAAELFAATDAFDQLWNVAVAWHEVKCGPQTATVIRQLREQGGLDPQTAICVDALSVHAAVVAQHVKAPAESNLLGHVQFLCELLDTHVLTYFCWLDTRDMVSDGLTKGAIDRTCLHKLMSGSLRREHDVKTWTTSRRPP